MSVTWPTSLDNFPDPTRGDTLLSADHVQMHVDHHEAIERLQAKVGIDSSAVTTSHDYMLQNRSQIFRSAYASPPSSPRDLDVWLPSDGAGQAYVRVSSAWVPFGGDIFQFIQPVDSGYSWVNQGSATISSSFGGLRLYSPGAGSGANLRGRAKSAPATPWTLTVFMRPMVYSKSFLSAGIFFRDSASGKIHVFDILGSTLRSSKLTSATAFSADYTTTGLRDTQNWLRITDNGTNRICSVSENGQDWLVFHTIGRTDFLTADQYGFHVCCENNTTPNLDVATTLLSLAVT